jgi:hypothetical protein
MLKPGYIYQGLLHAAHLRVQVYAPRVAELLRNSKVKLRNTCKMLYWFNHPTIIPHHHIHLVEYSTGISSAHPGQTRFLAAVLLNLEWPVIAHTAVKHTELVIDAQRLERMPRSKVDLEFGYKCEQMYMSHAVELEHKYGNLTSLEFYARVQLYCPSA